MNVQTNTNEIIENANRISLSAHNKLNTAKDTFNAMKSETKSLIIDFEKGSIQALRVIAIIVCTAFVIAIIALTLYFCSCLSKCKDLIVKPKILSNGAPEEPIPRMSPYAEAILNEVMSQSLTNQ